MYETIAEKRLRDILHKGCTIYTIRIDYGRRDTANKYYAVLAKYKGEMTNISGHVACLVGRKWSNNNGPAWANSSGVLSRTDTELVEQLANELFGAAFHHVQL